MGVSTETVSRRALKPPRCARSAAPDDEEDGPRIKKVTRESLAPWRAWAIGTRSENRRMTQREQEGYGVWCTG